MLELLKDRHKCKIIGYNAKIYARKKLSYTAIGRMYEKRILEISN